MSTLRKIALCALVMGVASAGTASVHAEEGSLYDVTMKMELVGLPMQLPEQTTQVCGPKDHLSQRMVPHEDNCSVTDFEIEGNTSRYTLVCTGETQMTAKGEFERLGSGDYRGKMNMVGSAHGQSMEMNMQFEGKRVGDCEYTPPAVPAAVSEASSAG